MMSINSVQGERAAEKTWNRQRIFGKVHSLMSGECLELMQCGAFSVLQKGIRDGFAERKNEQKKAWKHLRQSGGPLWQQQNKRQRAERVSHGSGSNANKTAKETKARAGLITLLQALFVFNTRGQQKKRWKMNFKTFFCSSCLLSCCEFISLHSNLFRPFVWRKARKSFFVVVCGWAGWRERRRRRRQSKKETMSGAEKRIPREHSKMPEV